MRCVHEKGIKKSERKKKFTSCTRTILDTATFFALRCPQLGCPLAGLNVHDTERSRPPPLKREMSQLGEIGEIVPGEVRLEWKIKDFFSLSNKQNDEYRSSDFSFAEEKWYLRLFPNGDSRATSAGWVSLYLQRKLSDPSKTVYFKFGIKGYCDNVVQTKELNKKFSSSNKSWGLPQFHSKSDLENRKSILMPNSELTITCVLRCDAKNAVSKISRVCKVSRNMKTILEEGKRSDFTLKLGDREWPVHKVILESRCKYFANMFRHDWIENSAGEVKLEDMDEDALDSVLDFIYTGEVERMSSENVCEIYSAAHKLLLEDLKELCIEYMKENMCIEIIYKVLVIADTYEEGDLNESAIEYFIRESGKILDTEEWKGLKKNHLSIVADLLEETTRRGMKKETK